MDDLQTMTEPVKAMESLPQALDEGQIIAALHRFRLESDGHSEIRMGPPGSRSVIISSTDAVHLQSDWQLLLSIVDQLDAHVNRRAQRDDERLIPGRSSRVHRPVELLDSPLTSRLPDGGLCLKGDAARLLAALDQRFLQFARRERAEPMECPPIWHRDQLARFGYQDSSPNLLTVKRSGNSPTLFWQLAVCNNVWLHLSGQTLAKPAGFTARGTCCRGEGGHYFMLERMRSFSMREVMFVGLPDDVQAFKNRALAFVANEADELGLKGRLTPANDPFFLVDQTADGDADTSKMELRLDLYDDKSIACASVNVHSSFFTEQMNITGPDPDSALWTACTAFGLERWVWAILVQYGPRSQTWPEVLQTMVAAT